MTFSLGWPPDNDCTVVPGLGHFLPTRDHSMGNLHARTCWFKKDFPLSSRFTRVKLTSWAEVFRYQCQLLFVLSVNHDISLVLLTSSWHLLPGGPNNDDEWLKVNTTYEKAGEKTHQAPIFTLYSPPRLYN